MKRRTNEKKEGKKMLPWWVALLFLIGGIAFGLYIAALLIADERDGGP